MNKLLFFLIGLLSFSLVACGSDSEIDSSAILEIETTPILETISTAKPAITQSSPITPIATQPMTTQIVVPTKVPQTKVLEKSITQDNKIGSG